MRFNGTNKARRHWFRGHSSLCLYPSTVRRCSLMQKAGVTVASFDVLPRMEQRYPKYAFETFCGAH